jgi:hypothetical protein
MKSKESGGGRLSESIALAKEGVTYNWTRAGLSVVGLSIAFKSICLPVSCSIRGMYCMLTLPWCQFVFPEKVHALRCSEPMSKLSC